MKLHMESPHESSMDPMDFGVKRLKVKVTMQGLLKMVSGLGKSMRLGKTISGS